jgi:hypothetical protein
MLIPYLASWQLSGVAGGQLSLPRIAGTMPTASTVDFKVTSCALRPASLCL